MIWRIIRSLIYAALSVLLVGMVGAAFDLSPGAGAIALLTVPITTFILVFRASNTESYRRRKAEKAIEKAKREAVKKELPEKAQAIAYGYAPGGTWDAGFMRVTGGHAPRIELPAQGQWVTVFAAVYHPGKEGQIVPYEIEKAQWVSDWRREKYDPHVVRTREVGGHPAWWEVQVYLPGDWEDSLDQLVDAAKGAALAREQARFGV